MNFIKPANPVQAIESAIPAQAIEAEQENMQKILVVDTEKENALKQSIDNVIDHKKDVKTTNERNDEIEITPKRISKRLIKKARKDFEKLNKIN